MKLRTSDFLKIALFVALFYGPPGFLFFNYVRSKAIEDELTARKRGLESVADLIESLKIAGYENDVCSQLQSEARAERIILFSYKSESMSCSLPEGVLPESFPSPVLKAIYTFRKDGTEISYQRSEMEGAQLVLGYEKPKEHSLIFYIRNSSSLFFSMVIDFLLVIWVLLGFAIIGVYLNLDRVKKSLVGSKTNSFLDRIGGLFAIDQFEVLNQVGDETRRKIEQLTEGEIFSETNLQYSVLSEIKRQIKKGVDIQFPYKFEGVVVRVDINGYSEIMRNNSLEETREINTAFKEIAAELAYRYEGLFENSAGDEVVYCFRGEDRVFRGISFVRDLSEGFSAIGFGSDQSVRLFVKGSVYESEMVMDIGKTRVEFDGLALLYTNRMFGELQEKKKNVLIVSPSMLPKIIEMCDADSVKTISSKGMKVEVAYITQYKNILSEARPEFYRSDDEIVRCLKVITSEEKDSAESLARLARISRIKRTSAVVRGAWIEAVRSLNQNTSRRKDDPFVLPTLIALGAELISPVDWDEECSLAVKESAGTLEERVAENAIEALLRVGHANEAANIIDPRDFSGRLRANALLASARANPTESSLRRIRDMAKNGREGERVSGLYAAAQLVVGLKGDANRAYLGLTEYKELIRLLTRVDMNSVSSRVGAKIREALE